MEKILVFLIVTMFLAGNACADFMVGAAPGLVSFSVDDPDGDTDDITALVPLAAAFVYDINNKTRLYGTFNYIDKDLDASTTRIGQDVSGYQIMATWQHIIKLSYEFKFYTGAGLAFTQADFENRHTVDGDGYLVNRYPDRSESIISAVVCAAREWALSEKISLGLDLSYQLALSGDGFSGPKAAFTCFYRF